MYTCIDHVLSGTAYHFHCEFVFFSNSNNTNTPGIFVIFILKGTVVLVQHTLDGDVHLVEVVQSWCIMVLPRDLTTPIGEAESTISVFQEIQFGVTMSLLVRQAHLCMVQNMSYSVAIRLPFSEHTCETITMTLPVQFAEQGDPVCTCFLEETAATEVGG